MSLCGLELIEPTLDNSFLKIGERCNIAGSLKFKQLIMDGNFSEAVQIAREQADGAADVLDFNVDNDGQVDGEMAMTKLLNLAASDPDISRKEFIVDSSNFKIIEAGLKTIQGKRRSAK